MNKQIKSQWVEALLNGEYEQGHGRLRSDATHFCCLGVLCDLYAKTNGVQWDKKADIYFIDDESSLLPDAVVCWAELTQHNPVIEDIPLASLNDGIDHLYTYIPRPSLSFDEIALLIKEHL